MANRFSKMMGKVWLIVFFAAAGAGLLFYLWQYGPFSPGAREARRAENFIKEWEDRYKNDTYGGATPEETLQLFITALKNGDTDLAAKYFLIDDQEKWREDLSKIKEKNLLEAMVKDLERLKKTRADEKEVFYTTTNEENIVSVQLIIRKTPYNDKWKIIEL
ncbi:MAG: hypothetical protein AAB911_01480 [Patescibacteria group bacterium]